MSIWLGFPEESSEDGGEGTDEIQTKIDEIQTLDQEIDQLQDQMVVELETADSELKKTEKEEFVEEANLGAEGITVTDETTWSEIVSTYSGVWGDQTGPRKDALEDKLFRIRPIMDITWGYGNPAIPHGALAVTTERRIANAYKGNTKTNERS